MSFFPEVEVGGEHVLGKMHRDVPRQNVQRCTGRFAQYLGQNTKHGHREHEPRTEGEACIYESKAPPEMSYHHEGTEHIPERSRRRKSERAQGMLRASFSND